MFGVVNLDKPVGPTSHDMVALLRRLSDMRRIGHAGTLDPLASGVLPILVGAATRLSDELTAGPKRYEAVIRLGATSATDDTQGPIQPVDATLPEEAVVRASLADFVGTFLQQPPAYSARKVGGRVAHREARAGTALDLPAREVTVYFITLLELRAGPASLDVAVDIGCAAGTYVRSLARDLGQRLGCGGHLAALRRTEAAGLTIDDSISPERLEAMASSGRLADALRPVGALLRLPRIALDGSGAWRFVHGTEQPADSEAEPGRVAVYHDEQLIGIGRVAAGVLAPEKVLPSESVVA